MARLTTIKPRLSAIAPRLVAPKDEQGRSQYRDRSEPWRKWYRTARWAKLRWQVLSEALFTCAFCGRIEGDTSQLIGDHITPHKGDESMFFDRGNVQCLCVHCHNGTKQRMERRYK